MLEPTAVILLSAAAVLLNAHAARVADRSGARRAKLEARWSTMIADAGETPGR